MSVEDILVRCSKIIRQKRYSRHPFVAELERVSPTKADLGRWAVQKYHQVFLQNSIFSAIHANAFEYESVRQFMMEQLVAEETSITSGSDSHYNLMKRFAEACGAGPGSFHPSQASVPVRDYICRLLSICRDRHFALGLLAIYAIESQSSESVSKVQKWLRSHFDFKEQDLEWFVVHANEEDDHACAGLKLVKQYAAAVPDFKHAAVRTVEEICDAWLVLHDYYFSLLRGDHQKVGVALQGQE